MEFSYFRYFHIPQKKKNSSGIHIVEFRVGTVDRSGVSWPAVRVNRGPVHGPDRTVQINYINIEQTKTFKFMWTVLLRDGPKTRPDSGKKVRSDRGPSDRGPSLVKFRF